MSADEGCTVKRVAFCSAMCAGFAYIGYSIMSKILFKTNQEEIENKDTESSKFLSKSIQTEAPLLSGDYFNYTKSVRERVKDLNVIAHQFRKNSIPMPVSPEVKTPNNLTSSPWSSPLGCSKYLSYSAENISLTSPPVSPNFQRKTKLPVGSGKSSECLASIKDSDRVSRIPLPPDADVTMKTLQSLQKTPRKMTLFETRNIIALLYSSDDNVLVRTLTTVSNCAAFSTNQEQLCNAGCPDRLFDLLQHPSDAVKVSAAQAISNIVVMEKGYYHFRFHIPLLFDYAIHGGELLKSISLTALANLALNDASHKVMADDLGDIFGLAEKGSEVVQLQALRLLVNLSCNKDMIPILLLTKVSPLFFDLIHKANNREITLRFVTFLANIITYAVRDLDISSKNSTLMAFMYRIKEKSLFVQIRKLSGDNDEDISFQAKRLCDGLNFTPY